MLQEAHINESMASVMLQEAHINESMASVNLQEARIGESMTSVNLQEGHGAGRDPLVFIHDRDHYQPLLSGGTVGPSPLSSLSLSLPPSSLPSSSVGGLGVVGRSPSVLPPGM